jgi:hypothetical protein
VNHPNDPSHPGSPELDELASMLDEHGQSLRNFEGLESRLYGSSRDLILPPKTLRFPSRTLRIAAAACLLIACTLSIRFLTELPSSDGRPGIVDFSVAFDSETAGESQMVSTEGRENLILSILEARADSDFSDVEILDATDPVSLAFAPILGSTGFGFDDLETEIKSIEGTMGH